MPHAQQCWEPSGAMKQGQLPSGGGARSSLLDLKLRLPERMPRAASWLDVHGCRGGGRGVWQGSTAAGAPACAPREVIASDTVLVSLGMFAAWRRYDKQPAPAAGCLNSAGEAGVAQG